MFCASDATLTNEHVIPDWSREYLSGEAGPGTHTHKVLRASGENVEREYRAPAASNTVRSVCAACNNGWMSALEARAKPLLLTMMQAHHRTFYGAGQQTIASWATMKALVAGSRFETATPTSFYADFCETHEPLQKSRIWLMLVNERHQHYVDYRPLRVGAGQETVNAFASLLALAHVGFYVVGWEDDTPSFDALDEFMAALTPLWPSPGREVSWMPEFALDHAGLDRLADAIARLADGPLG